MTFKAEFAPAAIDAGYAQAQAFGSGAQYLERIMADAREELRQCAIADKDGTASRYRKQFNPMRGVEAFTAFNHAADLMKAAS